LREVKVWNGAGVGYHTLFGAPGAWTPVAKSCPGPKRKVQFHDWLVPWMKDQPTPVQRFKREVLPVIEAARQATSDSRQAAHEMYDQVEAAVRQGPRV
jgi:hypothetical protein